MVDLSDIRMFSNCLCINWSTICLEKDCNNCSIKSLIFNVLHSFWWLESVLDKLDCIDGENGENGGEMRSEEEYIMETSINWGRPEEEKKEGLVN